MIGNQMGPSSDVECVGYARSGGLRGSREQALVNSPGNINTYDLLVYSLTIIVCSPHERPDLSPWFRVRLKDLGGTSQERA